MSIFATSCASTGATFGSGVGDRLVDEPPYYAGARTLGGATMIGHLPITFQSGSIQETIFEPEATPEGSLSTLLAEMNSFLDSLDVSTRLPGPLAVGATAPDVRFGCEQSGIFGDCDSDSDDISVQGSPWMLLSVGRPSQKWIESVDGALQDAGRDYSLVITLEIGQYWTHQKNFLGAKEVRLGTDYSQAVPWLTSLDQPVQVLQLTGALVGRDGRAVRIGAEGLFARRTNLVLSGFGIQELITDENVEKLRTARRHDLPGSPLVWQESLRNLVDGLTRQTLE